MSNLATKQSPTALAEIPEHLRAAYGNRAGLEDVGREDVLIPRLALAQDLTPQRKKSNESYIQGLETGQLFNSVTNEVYGTEVTVVPLYFFKQFIEFKPMNEGGGVVAMYASMQDVPRGGLDFVDGKQPRVTEFKNFMCLLIREDDAPVPIVVSFKSTGLKTAKQWISWSRMTNLPLYAKSYKLTSISRTKGSQEWAALKVTPGDFVPADFYQGAEKMFNELRASGVKYDTTGMSEENPDAEPAGGEPGF